MTIQRLSVVIVPTMSALLDDEVFLKYMHSTPKLPQRLQHGQPWRLLAKRVSGSDKPSWAVRDYDDYDRAYDKLCDLLDKPEYQDASLISKRLYMPPPVGFEWDTSLVWCSRCRRPTVFREQWRHPGVHTKGIPVSEEHFRCVLCGVKLWFAPTHGMRL